MIPIKKWEEALNKTVQYLSLGTTKQIRLWW